MPTTQPLYQAPNDIFDQMMSIFLGSDFDYFKTREPGFVPRDVENVGPHLFPWGFVEMGPTTEPELDRAPSRWKYEQTFYLVVLTHADRGQSQGLVYSDGLNANKGVGDIQKDIGNVFWYLYKENRFGVSGVRDWSITFQGTPTVLTIQRLLVHPLIRGRQFNFTFEIVE